MTDNVQKRKKSIPSTVKRLVWNKYIGEEIGKSKCLCCGLTDITQMSFHCGHVISEHNGGKIEVSNLKPICQNCNSSMGIMNMDEFIKLFKIKKEKDDVIYVICECCGRKMRKQYYYTHKRTFKYVLNMKTNGVDASIIKPREKNVIVRKDIKKTRINNKIEEERIMRICNRNKKMLIWKDINNGITKYSVHEQQDIKKVRTLMDKYGFKKYDDMLITKFYNYDCLDNLIYLLRNKITDTKDPETLKQNERNKIIKTIISKLGFSLFENNKINSDDYDNNVKELFKDDMFNDCEKINKLFGFAKKSKLNDDTRFFNKQVNTMLYNYSLKINYTQVTRNKIKVNMRELRYINNLNEIILNKTNIDVKPFEPEKTMYDDLLTSNLTPDIFE